MIKYCGPCPDPGIGNGDVIPSISGVTAGLQPGKHRFARKAWHVMACQQILTSACVQSLQIALLSL